MPSPPPRYVSPAHFPNLPRDDRDAFDSGVAAIRLAIVLGIAALTVAAWLFSHHDSLQQACSMAQPHACERLDVYVRAFGWLATSGTAMLLTVVLAWTLREDQPPARDLEDGDELQHDVLGRQRQLSAVSAAGAERCSISSKST